MRPTLPAASATNGAAVAATSADTRYLADAIMEAAGQRPHARMYPYLLGVNRLGPTLRLAANATASDQAPVGGDAAFLAVGVIGQATGDFLFNLRWSHLSGATLAQIQLHSKALFGTEWRPFAFPRPQLMPHDSTLFVDLTNLTAAPNDIALYVYGVKVLR